MRESLVLNKLRAGELVNCYKVRMTSMNDAWEEMVKFSVGHPNLLYLGNKEVLAYFYAGDHCDQTEIEFIRMII